MSRVPSIGPARSFQIGNGILVNSTGIMKDGEYITDSGGGMPGLSAYEIAVSHGFIGTEQEWLDSLHGASGEASITASQIAALEGTSGTPSTENKFVTDTDVRNSDNRVPHSHNHAPGDISGTAIVEGDARLSDTRNPKTHDHSPAEITGTAVVDNDSRLSDSRTPLTHNHVISGVTNLQTTLDGKAASDHAHIASDITGTAVITNDSRLSDARTPTAHTHAIGEVTNLTTTLTGKEPANSNIQTHVAAAHAPSNAQKNSDITKAEIEAKLTGEISTHTHAGGGGGLGYALPLLSASQSTTTDAQTLYWGGFAVAPSTTANRWRVYILKPGTIKVAQIYSYAGTAGSAEAWVMNIRKNNTTDTLIASLSVSTNDRLWANYALSIAVIVGDYIEIKEVCPTWATNPATVTRRGAIYIE